jgi:hypothetical protein
MRRILILMLIVAVGLLLMPQPSQAASEATVTITVLVASLCVSVDKATWDVGTVQAAGAKVMSAGDKITITNCGNVAENFSLRVGSSSPGSWPPTGPGENAYRMLARMTGTSAPAEGDYSTSNDLLTSSTQVADGAKFGAGGNNITASGTAPLWLRFDAPTSLNPTSQGQQTITLTVGCQIH